LIRTEVIANRAVEEDLLEEFAALNVFDQHTRIPGVHGVGTSGQRRGDHIWPEENVLFLFYGDRESGDRVVEAVRRIKERFPDEGVRLFQFKADVFEL